MDGERFNGMLLALLGRTDGAAAERALMQVLQAAEGPLQRCAMRELLGRRGGSGATAVARKIPTLDAPARDALLADMALLEPVARAALRDDDESIRLTALEMLQTTQRASSAYLLVGAVTDSAPAVRARAAEAIVQLLRRHRDDPTAMNDHLIPAVTSGVRGLASHRCGDLLKAAVLLGRHCNRDVFRQINLPANRLTEVFARVLRDLQPDEAAEFVFMALPYPHAGNVSRSYIAQASWDALAALGARDWWRLLKPIGAGLLEIHHLRAVAADPQGLSDLDGESQACALRLVLACGIAAKLRRTLIGQALAGPQPAALTAAPYALDGPESSPETILLALHCPHKDVQAAAAARILAAGIDGHMTQHLLKSLPALAEPVQAVVGQYLAARSFDRYWHSYSRLGQEVRAAAGRALLKLDARVVDLLAGRLAGSDVNEQMQAIQLIRQLSMADRYAAQLARMARSGDRMVRSGAVAALGVVNAFDARSTLARCLDDEDMRVQANAIEALERAGCEPSTVLDKLDSPNNRVRANAIKWLVQADHSQGAMALADMLTDPRASHRISATWVVKVLNYRPAAALVRRLAKNDPDTQVRARMATATLSLDTPTAQEAGV